MKSIIMLNDKIITQNTIKFSAGEVQVKVPVDVIKTRNIVTAHICDSDGIMLLMQLSSVIKKYNNTLIIPYLPYSRYDRIESPNDALSLKVFCDMINTLEYNSVITHDCHSDVGVALLNNCMNIQQHQLVLEVIDDVIIDTYDAIVSPDAGASKKAFKLAELLNKPLIECGKHRDFKTGKIINFTVPSQKLLDGNITNVLIVDDIADGGGTFIGLANELRMYVDNVDLYVTHGIFSKGTKQLRPSINNIYSYNNWSTIDPDTFNQ